MRKMTGIAFCLAGCLLFTLCAFAETNNPAQSTESGADTAEIKSEVQYDYQLKAGEITEVYDTTFDKMVTVTVDPDSTKNAANNLRSNAFFDNCTFNGGLTIIGNYHAMISLGSGCSFGDDSIVAYQAVDSDAAKKTRLEDNLVKLFVSCEGVSVETTDAMGAVSDGPDITVNGTAYSKTELAPDTAYLAIYTLYENDSITYVKLAITEDEDITFLD